LNFIHDKDVSEVKSKKMKYQDLVLPKKIEIDKATLTESYGKFIAEPFERGYGHTLGNSLRRLLLSSIEGAAVTAVRINGAMHEYTTLKGVKEDVLEILLNLKALRFKMYSPGPEKLYLRVSKREGEVRAKDIQLNENVKIVNSEQLIATLDSGGQLEMEIEVSRGRGYLLTEKQKRENLPVGTMLLDVAFSPVKKVHYEVENARVGQIIEYDRLILEIWTDGTVGPVDALAYAAKILRDSASIFIPYEEEEIEKKEKVLEETKPLDERLREILNQSVEIIELSVRVSNCLKNAQIKTIGELVRKSEEELLAYRNFGRKSLEELKMRLKELGLGLGMEV